MRERVSWMREHIIWIREREKEGIRARKCRMKGNGRVKEREGGQEEREEG
jgi:hypothetical protein